MFALKTRPALRISLRSVTVEVPDLGPVRLLLTPDDPLLRGGLLHRFPVRIQAQAGAYGDPMLPVVALVADETGAVEAWQAGARVVLRREATPTQLTTALLAARQGLVVIDPDLLAALLPLREPPAPDEELTPREREVLHLMAEGLPNKLIADRLGVSENTVKFHVNAILSKLDAHSRTEAVTRAARKGLLTL
jgi:DNA-binding NarL/FixJ family response regulator